MPLPTHIMFRKALYRQVVAARQLFYHGTATGTSNELLRRILKEGLNPNPPQRVFDKDTTQQDPTLVKWTKRDLETYGGVYFAADPAYAASMMGNAIKKFGGTGLLVAAQLETRTPTTRIDEDLLLSGDEFYLNIYLEETRNVTPSHYYILQMFLNPREIDWTAVADHYMQSKILRRWAVGHQRLQAIKPLLAVALELQAKYWLVKTITSDMANWEVEELFRTKYKGIKDPEVLRHQYRQAAEKVLQKLREVTNRQREDYRLSTSQKIRILEPVGFSGVNHIVALMVIIKTVDEPYHTKVVVTYNKGGDSAVEQVCSSLTSFIGPYMLWTTKDGKVLYDNQDPRYHYQRA